MDKSDYEKWEEENEEMQDFFEEHKGELTSIVWKKPASEDAVFFVDLVEQRCGCHVGQGCTYLCRRNGPQWENALLLRRIDFPAHEIVDNIYSSTIHWLWVEPSMWLQLNLPPNCGQSHSGLDFISIAAATHLIEDDWDYPMSRDKFAEQWREFANRFKGLTYGQASAKGLWPPPEIDPKAIED